MNNKMIWVAVGAVVVLALGGYLLLGNKATNTQTTPTQTETTTTNPTAGEEITNTPEVTATANGYEPQIVTVKVGDTVTWTNKSGTTSNVSSDVHPTHLLFPFLNLGNFDDGSSVSVVFDKAGEYTYHNHINASQKGTVIVK